AQGRGPGRGVLAHPAVVDEPDRDGVQEVQLLAPALLRDPEAGLLEHPQVLHHAEARHRQSPLERAERLPVFLEQRVEQPPARRGGKGPEHCLHTPSIRDCLVTCQRPFRTHARDASTAHPETSPVARLPLSRGQGAANGSAALLHRRAMASPHDLEQHRAALTGHCYRMMGSAADADDAVPETMVRGWRGLGGFEERASLRTWLTRIATRVCLDAL